MFKLAILLFLHLSTAVSPHPLSTSNKSSMDMKANPNMVLFKSNALPTTSSSSFCTNPALLQMKAKEPIFVFSAGMGAALPLMDMDTANVIVEGLRTIHVEAKPTFLLVILLPVSPILILGILYLLLLCVLNLAGRCGAIYSKRTHEPI